MKIKGLYVIGFLSVIFCLIFSGQLATMQTAENAFRQPPTPAPAAGVQLQPDIAKGATSSLAVWADQRNIINRFSSRDADEVGSLSDIYAARYDASGNLVDTTPIIVSQAIYSQRFPRVAWNGQNWLVAWITERANYPFAEDVHAVRVSPEGRVLDVSPIVIGVTPSSSSTAPSYLDVASDGNNWVVVWGTGSYNSQIRGARIQPDGTLIDVGGDSKVLFDDTGLSTAPGGANLVFAGNQFMLVWDRIVSGGYGIRAQRFNQNLDPIDAQPFVVNTAGGNADDPQIATDGTNFFVVWRDSTFAYERIFGTRISAAGQILDTNGIQIYGAAGGYIMPLGTSLAWDGAAYVAAFHSRPVGTFSESVYAARISANGAIGAPVAVADQTEARQPAVAALAGGSGAQIVWTAGRLSVDGDIFTATLSTNNTLSAATAASLGAPRETRARFAVTDTGNFAVVFRSTVSGASSVYLQRLNSSGNQIDVEPILITSGTENVINPSVAWNGANYLVVWELDGQTFGRRVGADGVPMSAEFLVSTGNMPDVAALGDQFLVVNSFPRTNQLRHTQATRVSDTGAVNTPVRIGNNFDLRPRVRRFGNRWLAIWESDISHDNPNSSIQAAFVNADGTSPSGEFTIGSLGDDPHFAVAGNTALVVWEDGNDIRGRRISADGTFPEASKIVADASGSLTSPAIASDGARFVLTYTDNSRRTTFAPSDIWATLIGIDSTVLTLGGFPVADSTLSEEQPAVEGSNGTTIFGFAKFEDRAPFAAHRIRLRRFPFDRDFFVSTVPFARTIPAGATTDYTVNITSNNNFNQPVNLSVDGLPAGATATFDPPTISGSGSSTLTIATSPATPEDIYSPTINATSGAQTSRTKISLVVDDNPPPNGFGVTDLGTLGGSQSEAQAINDSGQIVGWAFNAAQQRRAFLYQNNQMTDLGTFGGNASEARDINNGGQIVGFAKNTSNYERAFLSNNGAAIQNLGTLGGDRSYGYAINNNNQISGSAALDTQLQQAFLYQNNQMQSLGMTDGSDVNNAGKVLGSRYVGGTNGGFRPVIYYNGNYTVLPTLGGADATAFAINDSDQVVGTAATDPSQTGYTSAFLYQNNQMQNLGTLGAPASRARDINNNGQIVGSIQLTLFGSEYRAFLYENGTMRNLNSLIPASSGWVLNEAFGINNAGQIVGRGAFNNQTRAFLLTPNGSQNQPPTVQITSPTVAQNFGDSNLLTIAAAALDADGAVVKVEFYADGNLVGTATSSPFVVLWNASAGTHVLTAKAFDNAGAAVVSAPVTITVGASSNGRTRFDFDGDGKADISVFRPSSGIWYLNNSQSGFSAAQFGISTDKLVPADYDGDGKTDLAVYRNGIWYLQRSSSGFTGVSFGTAEDVPVPADYSGDGKAEIAVFRPSSGVWYFLNLTTNQPSAAQFGQTGDKPLAADFDADGKDDIAVYRGGVWYIQRSSQGFTGVQFGEPTDKPLAADFDADGKADIAVFRSGVWYLNRSRDGFLGYQFGLANDKPAAADYDGDGRADIAVFRNGIWYIQASQNGLTSANFGLADDKPIPNSFVP